MTRTTGDAGAFIGLDVGTSSAKAALFAGDGTLLASAWRPLPTLEVQAGTAWQPLEGCVQAAEHVLEAILGERAARAQPVPVALTTQRDTLVLLDTERRPLTPLISWADRRDRAFPSLWHALASSGGREVLDAAARVRSLASHLAERWTGRAAETAATLPRHLVGEALSALRELTGRRVRLPEIVGPGSAVGRIGSGSTLHQAGGDKNCELLGSGVDGPGRAGLSLGSAISLGVMAAGRPEALPGTVVTAAALEGRWNVETGLPAGMRGWDVLEGWLGPGARSDPGLEVGPGENSGRGKGSEAGPNPDIVVVPYLEGGLDRPDGRLLIWGLEGGDPRALLRRGWRQGVVAELRRLRPRLEEAVGVRVEAVRLSGGGSRSPHWARLVADALGAPVEVGGAGAGWEACRGAVLAALHRQRAGSVASFRHPAREEAAAVEPDPEGERAWKRYAERYEILSRAAALRGPAGVGRSE